MKKKGIYVASLFFLGLVFIYWFEIKREFTSQKVYVVFDLEEDYLKTSDELDKLSYPKKFILLKDEKKIFGIKLSESEEINFINEKPSVISDKEYSKIKKTSFDSIVNLFNEHPFNYSNDYFVVLVNQRTNRNYVYKTEVAYIIY